MCMILLRSRVFLVGIFLILQGCVQDNALYTFPALSAGQLVDLKKASEQIEGFFLTTDLSDVNVSGSKIGSQIYVCVRFLNDPTVNIKLKKSTIPLLVQVSTDQNVPQAESVLLVHPKTKGVFYYEESQVFKFPASPFVWNNKEYDLLDFYFNKDGKVSSIYFKQKGMPLEDIRQDIGQNIDQYVASADGSSTSLQQNDSAGDNISTPEGSVLKISSFAKLDSTDCSTWPRLRYTHVEEIPEYLQVYYIGKTQKNDLAKTTPSVQQKNNPTTSSEESTHLPPVTNPPPPIADLNAPFNPVPKQDN